MDLKKDLEIFMKKSLSQILSVLALTSLVQAALPNESCQPEAFAAVESELLSENQAAFAFELIDPLSASTSFHLEPGPSHLLRNAEGDLCLVSEGFSVQEREGFPLLPRLSHFIEVPSTGDVHLVVDALELQPLELEALSLGYIEETQVREEIQHFALEVARFEQAGFDQAVHLATPVIFRDLRMVSIAMQPFFLQEGVLQRVLSLDFHLEYGELGDEAVRVGSMETHLGSVSGNEKLSHASWSTSMEATYQGLCLNHGQFYNDVDDSIFPVYLITGSPDYLANPAYMAEFVKWKREKGFDVRVVPFDQIAGGGQSIDFGSLRNWVREAWVDLRPEYLLLVGDDDDDAACPDSVVQSSHGEFDVSDHFFGLLEGDDYFPDLFVGRFSVDSPQQLYVMAQKPVVHEKMPLMAGAGWLEHGLVVSCNFSDSGNHPISPNLTSRWVIDKLRANGFTITSDDSLFYPPLADGGALITNALNAGRGIVNYRGWANSNGWIYPAFDRDDIYGLSNAMKMPIVASFVCQTGAYGAGQGVNVEDPCFGEAFVRHGDPGAPKGAVAFIGPSDLHTRSQFNNPVCSGFYNAIFDLNLSSIAPALLNGKMELYRGYPLVREDPHGTYFYFHVYNVLGDPNLQIWRSDPGTLLVEAPSTLAPGSSSFEITVRDAADETLVDGVLATLTAGADRSLLLARGRVQQGSIVLNFDESLAHEAGELVLTVSSLNHTPNIQTVEFGTTGTPSLAGWAVTEENADGLFLPGETLTLQAVLANTTATDLAAGTLTLRDPVDWPLLPLDYTLSDAELHYDAIAQGAEITSSETFTVVLSEALSDAQEVLFMMDALSGEITSLLRGTLTVQGLAFEIESLAYASGAEGLLPLQSDALQVQIVNTGSMGLEAPLFELISSSDLVQVLSDPLEPGALAIGENVTLSFELRGGVGLFAGMLSDLQISLSDGVLQSQSTFTLPTAERAESDPRGPDAYGYWAVESEDYAVQLRPDYDWIELDPTYGGQGAQRLYLIDDDVVTLDAPFPIQFYGEEQSQISVCSNGWISFGETWMNNFRNWNVPSALGPSNMVCAFWDDLKPRHMPPDEDSLYVPVYFKHEADQGRLVIEWSRSYNRYAWENAGQPKQEFQIVIYDQSTRPTPTGDNEILLQYKDVTDLDQDNNFATVGIQNFGHNVGLEISYASRATDGCFDLAGGRSILITTRTPLNATELRVEVLQPLPAQWLNLTQPLFTWNHEQFALDLGDANAHYFIEVFDAEDVSIFSQEVVGAGSFDLAETEFVLPESDMLRFSLSATSDEDSYAALQGDIFFFVDATPPTLNPALLSSALFLGDMELGVISSEPLSQLDAFALSESSDTVATFQALSSTLWEDGRELNYLQARATDDLHQVLLHAVDAHGLASEESIPLSLSHAGTGFLHRDDMRLEWQPASTGWMALIGQKGQAEDAALPALSYHHAFDLLMPAAVSQVQLRLAADAQRVLVRLEAGVASRVSQSHDGSMISAQLSESGRYALRSESEQLLPSAFNLLGNVPNPFNPVTSLLFELPAPGDVFMKIYNLQGQEVFEMSATSLEAGAHRFLWEGCNQDGTTVASGLYVAQVRWQNQVQSTRMLLLR
jgi:hypothetical protein